MADISKIKLPNNSEYDIKDSAAIHEIKTINNQSLIGTGNINISGGGGGLTFDDIYPVGSIYMSVNNTDPGTLFGGQWTQIEDTFLLASGSTYSAGDTGGTDENTLTSNNLPRLTGTVNFSSNLARNNATNYPIIESASGIAGRATRTGRNVVQVTTGNYGVSVQTNKTVYDQLSLTIGQTSPTALDNMPPYLAVYVWQRTA